MSHRTCLACGGEGIKRKWSDRRRYRYFVVIYHEPWSLVDEETEEEHGPLPKDQYLPAGLKYEVARSPLRRYSERLIDTKDGKAELLASCGRFTREWGYGRTFASDREADRTVERLASGLPVFITRAVAVAATFGVVLPAWLSLLQGC